jgi:HAD superfamily hydrolase (TIGR01509 family)
MANLQGLIFDVDGTIANTERDGHRIAFNEAFREAKLDWYWSEALYGELLDVAGGQERILHYMKTYHPEFESPAPPSEFALQLHEMKMRHYPVLLADGNIPLRPGVKRLLTEAREQGIPLAIATTSALPNVIALLEHTLGIESLEWFEVIAAGSIVPNKKPAPDVYLYVLEKMGWDASECLVIEDSNQGLTAAKVAGLRTLITYNSYTCDHNFEGAWMVLDHLGNAEVPCSQRAGEPLQSRYVTIEGLLELMTPKRSFYEKWFSLEKTPFTGLTAS